MEKHTVKVGRESGNIGETVSFTAEVLGRVKGDGGVEDGGINYTFYRLPDGNFRVLLEISGFSLLLPSNMEDAIRNGQRNNFSYGRMSEEEIKAHERFQLGEMYEKFMERYREIFEHRVRDLD